ncbi:MAG: hypothetical protein JO086_08915 [Acidimicrobiia bacterium]|nr:hypothetical protein [Acidimicrobiia bacterium]
MNESRKPPLVAAVEVALGTRVVALRYLPSPAAASSASPQNAAQVALDDLGEVHVAQPDLGGVLRPSEVDLTPDDEATR